MPNQQLDDYIKQSKQAGVSDLEIKKKLLESGWGDDAINQAFTNFAGISNSSGKPQKDYWFSAYKNFLHFSYFGYFIDLVLIILWIVKYEPISNFLNVWTILSLLVVSTAWFGISQLFKKHDKRAILAGYIFLSVIAILLLWQNSLFAFLLVFYLFYLVYKASKMSVS